MLKSAGYIILTAFVIATAAGIIIGTIAEVVAAPFRRQGD